jgi:hypothetical protein
MDCDTSGQNADLLMSAIAMDCRFAISCVWLAPLVGVTSQKGHLIEVCVLQAGQTGLDTLRRMSKAGLNKAATTVVTSAIMVSAVCTRTDLV